MRCSDAAKASARWVCSLSLFAFAHLRKITGAMFSRLFLKKNQRYSVLRMPLVFSLTALLPPNRVWIYFLTSVFNWSPSLGMKVRKSLLLVKIRLFLQIIELNNSSWIDAVDRLNNVVSKKKKHLLNISFRLKEILKNCVIFFLAPQIQLQILLNDSAWTSSML